MKRILILAEGQTEERFVKDVLNPVLLGAARCLLPRIIHTKNVKDGPDYKGGWNSYEQSKNDINRLLQDTGAVAVTTMLDFYGLPNDFPQWAPRGDCYEKVAAAEKAFEDDIRSPKFIPYLQLHEFEGILFTSPKDVVQVLRDEAKLGDVERITASYSSPEEINNGPTTHPSRRLLNLFPNYQKVVFGSLIANATSLEKIREKCPHFNAWFQKILDL